MSTPRKLIRKSILSVALATTAIFSGNAMAQDEGATLQALTDPSFVPFEMLDKDSGEMVGFDMDILAEVAKRAGFDYNLKTMSFSGIIPALQTGTADVAIAGITITDAREKVVDFTDPYYQSGLRILVPADNNDVQTMEDLKGLSISTKIGSTSYKYLTNRFGDNATVKPYPRTSNMYMAVLSGAVDAAVYDAPNVAYFAKTKGADKAKVVGPLYEAQPYGLAFVQGSEWVDDANAALKSMKEDGTYAEIYQKWFGKLPPKATK